ncbi:MAG: 1-(5-phosphoribosyl)-5-((5-phosphoribosylamino)methylideneamino)imidazole-4-carboxamide isomerase [Ferrovum sp. 37-45-19]|jgi:DUF971 family protein|uniref:gamma-butyrobetaine hydroxylase-like domain-containing protein n=1 Tax=Ferrovum sp. JA12 TaxID=1356299 RepID=UPI000702DA71|nr:DUF971 domain-containing protein [Ferrovum sp. JA12]OYV80508.1 MAG: 1-(5-phosphoribosyl)-5-((5-phosphoribosylamino)methylideneamino)imidazole-4-carboxamide isomerase [Ferrovum sp. 21-44-67]OYV94823.1 MAG: 1-(5-phosphoribosyl)-5-((5-phosphoribosylamino)methylideneamino)imidazole-4-carboxamide isomerase [Ferrovum sp. 37-45-19]OZB34144.1 MAG: 1-(5-phosphoribosyl)-5-((5-phosphoribosylamino)methylideneamino)imidazole-4-carboxamide isomerase [Ferrovum sp. 34-44-207]HQT81049.1 DUF971 domain-contain
MAGLTPETPWPTDIILHQESRQLEIKFDDNSQYQFPIEYLRVYSPSAEVIGHGPGQEILQTGKRLVTIHEIVPVGHYAIKIHFSDGHDTGIYSWDYLKRLGVYHEDNWADYLNRLEAAGASRDQEVH